MVVFDISINGKLKKCIGIKCAGAISTIVSFARRPSQPDEIRIAAGGLTEKSGGAREYLRWLDRSLAVGDEAVIRIRTAAKADAPVSRKRETAASVRSSKRRYLEHLKKELSADI
jgi:hypothetical protein